MAHEDRLSGKAPETLPSLDMPSPTLSDGVEPYNDADDAQSFIQPNISQIATRLTLPNSPALFPTSHNGYFGEPLPSQSQPSGRTVGDAMHTSESNMTRKQHVPSSSVPQAWASQNLAEASSGPRSSLLGVFQPSGTSHRRSTSAANFLGSDALRRLSKALPSVSLPTGLLPSPRFLNPLASLGPSSQEATQSAARTTTGDLPTGSQLAQQGTLTQNPTERGNQFPSTSSLKRAVSYESTLYSPLSRMSSYGDDSRFDNIREQVNSRFKAIVDSFEPPFRVPSLKNPFAAVEEPAPTTRSLHVPRNHSDVSRLQGHPLDRTLDDLTGDLIIMGGYRGSVLRSAEPPHRQLWVPVKVGLNIRKVNLELGLDPEDEENSEDTVISSGMLRNIGPVDMSKRLFKKLTECENYRNGTLRVHDYGYDWRLSPHISSKKLLDFVKALSANADSQSDRPMVIAHSLGGLITRHAVNQRPDLFSGVIYAGSPQRCINILGPFRNGDAVLLNEKLLTAATNFSMRSTFIFLPEDGFCFIDKYTGEEYRIDFYEAENWARYRLSPVVGEACLPPTPTTNAISTAMGRIRGLSENLSTRGRSASDSAVKIAESILRQANPFESKDRTLAPQMNAAPTSETLQETAQQTHSDDTKALTYLRRTLAETKQFRAEMGHIAAHQAANSYPPIAVIYGKSIPTVYAAKVVGREGIIHTDAYDDLVFRSGDGVVLAREAMPPEGYEIVSGGRISTERGHVTMLGDLEAVGRGLEAIVRGRRKGIGLGLKRTS